MRLKVDMMLATFIQGVIVLALTACGGGVASDATRAFASLQLPKRSSAAAVTARTPTADAAGTSTGLADGTVPEPAPPAASAPDPTPTPTPAPAPAPEPAPVTPVAPAGDNITSYGAVCDGQTNNTTAIAATIASAKSKGVAVVIPPGVCAYGDIIRLDGVKLIGSGDSSVLYALNWARESIFVYGDGVEIRQLKLSGVKAPSRQADWESTRISLFGATNFVIDSITIDGSAAAGIQTAKSTSNGRITNNTIKDTLSDSIHMTDKASYITVENNHIENSGDDGIAVVSYLSDGAKVHHITARNNVVLNNKWGRQMSVVGGSDVLYENNLLENNLAQRACLYIAQENSYNTFGAHNVVMQLNTLKNCGGLASGHGGIMMFSDGAEANTNITLTRNDLYQNGQIGIRVISNWNTGIKLDSNRVQGAGVAAEISSPGVVVTPYSSGSVGYTPPVAGPIPVPASGANITSFGAVCDGTTNDSAAIAAALVSAKGLAVPVVIPKGVCAYGDTIRLDGVKLIGSGDSSVLYALDWAREAIFVTGEEAEIRQLKLSGVQAPARQTDRAAARITLLGARFFVVDRVTIDGSAAAGIQVAASADQGRITNNRISNTLAHAIHLTDKASYIGVENNRIENAGDDGVAVYSYRSDGGLVNHITARNNVILNNLWGRQMSVVGGSDVLYENNLLENNLAQRACLYVAQEDSQATRGSSTVVLQRNTLKNCGGPATGHGGIMVFSDGTEANTHLRLTRNDIDQRGQMGQIGIRVIGNGNSGVTLDSNRIQGASRDTEITSPGVLVTPYSSGTVGYSAPP